MRSDLQFAMRYEFLDNADTHSSHSWSSTYMLSYSSYESPPSQTYSRKTGFACQSGSWELYLEGGKRRTSLKSIEFSEGGFHFNLVNPSIRLLDLSIWRSQVSHIAIRAGGIRCSDACVDEAVITVLQSRNIQVEDLFNVIWSFDLFDSYPAIKLLRIHLLKD